MKILSPMLADKAAVPLDVLLSERRFAAEQKINGDRCVIHVDDGRVAALSRTGKTLRNTAKFVKAFEPFTRTGTRWVFDGESLAGTLWLFDLIEAGDRIHPRRSHDDLGDDFQTRRRTLELFLSQIQLPDCIRLVPSYTETPDKIALYERMRDEGCEGVMFKQVDAPYFPGRRTIAFQKVKFRNEIDCVVVTQNVGGSQNFGLVVYDHDGSEVYVGEVTALAGDKKKIKIGDVVTVVYQHATAERKLFQPTFPRIRTDKHPHECLVDQFVYANNDVHA